MYSRRIFHWRCFVPNPRQFGTSCHDGECLWRENRCQTHLIGHVSRKGQFQPSSQVGSLTISPPPHLISNRYFRSKKLDYPGKETTKASKKYVNAMKALNVSSSDDLMLSLTNDCLGYNSPNNRFQPAVPRSVATNLRLRPSKAYSRQGSSKASLVQRKHCRRRYRGCTYSTGENC